MKRDLKLGDTVTGTYHDVPIRGIFGRGMGAGILT